MQNPEITDERDAAQGEPKKRRTKIWLGGAAAIVLMAAASQYGLNVFSAAPAPAAPAPASVGVSAPLEQDLASRLQFTGQFAPVKQVELRAQVGGTLSSVNFKDGDIVHAGQVLFQIDPEPYRIEMARARATLEAANARLSLATRELARAEQLKSTDAGSAENVDQKVAEKRAAQAAVDGAQASVRDAKFDLDRTRVRAPFTGRIGSHEVSAGNLISGNRAGTGPTTLLATLVSLDPIWLNFDMSESDYLAFQRQRAAVGGKLGNKVSVALADETHFDRAGTLDFIDNAINRGSGTIQARATLPNGDAILTPGAFGRVRLAVSAAAPTMLVPDAAVLADQSDHAVLVVGKDNIATMKSVEVGELRGGLRVIKSGLAPNDRVIIEGVPSVRPGSPVSPHASAIRFAADQD